MNKQLQKDVEKALSKVNVSSEQPNQGRRYEPEGGVNKHNERIHRESKFAKEHKNLPFTFRKPYKPLGKSSTFECPYCGHICGGTTKTVCFICSSCNQLVKLED